jgi:hypothetical protein
MARSTKKRRAEGFLIAFFASLGLCVWGISKHDLPQAIWSGAYAVASIGWVILTQWPTYCGVITKKGYPCPNRTTGTLFGCGNAEGHTWGKFLSRLGIHREVSEVREASNRSATQSHADVRVQETSVVQGAEEPRRAVILFWLTVTATTAGVVSMTTDVIGLFN